MNRAVLAAFALAGCTATAPAPSPAPVPETTATPAPKPAPVPPATTALSGSHWEIEAIDGKPIETGYEGAKPALTFAERSYSAYAGCNAMGGLYAQRGARLYTLPGPQTEMGCNGRLGRQENIVDLVLKQGPTIAGDGDRVSLTAGAGSMTLRRAEPPRPPEDAPEAWQGTSLAGQTFEFTWVNGDPLNRRPAPKFEFADNMVRVTNICGAMQVVRYRLTKGSVTFEGGRADCLGGALAGGTMATVSGPNGELLLAGDGHWLGGDNVRRDRPKDL